MADLHHARLLTTLRVTLVLLLLATWAIVWQAKVIQDQKHMIRRLSGYTFID